jgi:hypothetical protein
MDRFHTLALGHNKVVLDTAVGHIRSLEIEADGRTIAPLHTAPWVGDGPIDPNSVTAPVEQALSGDFLCAPFCANDIEDGPIHGWPANAPWGVAGVKADTASATAEYTLSRDVLRAKVTKTLAFRAGEPFLYMTHSFAGGTGHIPIGHHAMIRVSGTAALSFSPKRVFFTPDGAPEPDPKRGRSLFTYPATGDDPSKVPLADGGTVDMATYPVAQRHEDIVSLAEAADSTVGWTAAVRDAEDDIVLLIKDARVFPCTNLWMSNGGRDYAPWNGRHIGVLGLEDTRSYGTAGHRASINPNPLSDAGTPTSFALNTSPVLRYAVGAIPRPPGWTRIANLEPSGDMLVLTDVSGKSRTLPFAVHWLLGESA